MSIGKDTEAFLDSKDAAVAMLVTSACARINRILKTENPNYKCVFTMRPSTQPPDSQVQSPT